MKKQLFLLLFLFSKLLFSQILVNESFEGTTLPVGWVVGSYGTDYQIGISAGIPCHGSKALTFLVGGHSSLEPKKVRYFSNQSNGKDIFYSFKYLNKKENASSTISPIKLLVRYSNNNGINWTELERVTSPVVEANCETVSGKIPGIKVPAGSNFVFEVGFSNGNGYTIIGIDDVDIEQKPNNFSCYMPLDVTTSNISNTSAQITWANQGASVADAYDYFISTTNTAPDDNTIPTGSVSGSSTSATVNILQPDTNYYLWVRSSCGSSTKSFWTNPKVFKTECNPAGSIFENFSNTVNYAVPQCWDCIKGSGCGTSYISNSNDRYLSLSNIVALPPLHNINSGLNRIKFKSWVESDNPAQIEVGYVTNLSASTFVSLQSFTVTQNYISAIDRMVTVPGNLPLNARLAIKNIGSEIIAIDNVFWEPIPTCSAPTNLNISDYDLNSLTINWAAGSTGSADSFEVYYTTGIDIPINNTTPKISGIVGNSVTLTNLVPNNVYRVWIRASCTQGGKSDWSSTYVSNVPCLPDVIGSGRIFEYFNTTGGIYNINYVRNLNAGYNNQSSSVLTVAKGTTFNYTGKAATIFTHSYYMWIDWNKDGQFDNVTEKVFLQYGNIDAMNGSYFIDSNRPVGYYKMRIATSWSNSSLTPCGFTPASSGFIDFTLKVVDPPSCVQPRNLVTSNITGTGVNLAWQGNSSGSTYDIFYSLNNTQPLESSMPIIQGVTGTSTAINNLSPFSKYYVWVRENCGNGNYSYWSVSVSFETGCQSPVFTSTSGETSCAGGKATLAADCGGNCSVRWYDSAVGGNLLYKGNSYLTDNLTTSTTYYAEASYTKELPPIKPIYNSEASVYIEGQGGLVFSSNEFFTLKSVDVFVRNATASNVTIQLLNQNGQIMYTKSFSVIGGSVMKARNTLELNWDIPPGIDYQIKKINPTTGTLPIFVQDEYPGFPVYIGNVGAITKSIYYSRYDFFFNWKVLTYCNSQRQGVLANVDSTCLGVDDVAIKKDDIQVYPNPFTDDIQIGSKQKVDVIMISDISGRQIKAIKNPDLTLHLSDLTSGFYVLTVKLKTGLTKTFKIFKK